MSKKPLVLIAPTPAECGERCNCLAYYFPDRGFLLTQKAEEMARAKRFTDAELAAEYWKAATIDTTYWGADDEGSPDGARAVEQTITLRRFATLPHYDEEI